MAAELVASQRYAIVVNDYISSMPLPPSTGDPVRDGETSCKQALLRAVVKGCLHDSEAILKVHGAYADYNDKVLTQYQFGVPRELQFPGLVVFAKMDEVFLGMAMVQITDLTSDILKKSFSKPQNIEDLFEGLFQLPPSLVMLGPLQIKDVALIFLKKRHICVGQPLQDCVAKMAVKMDGTLDYKKLPSYTPKFDDTGQLVGIRHRNGDEVACTFNVTRDNPMRYAWSDWRCCWPLDPQPSAKLHLFFKKAKKGPYKNDAGAEFGQKGKKYIQAVEAAHEVWRAVKDSTSASAELSKAVDDAKVSRASASKAVKSTKMAAARELGQAAIKRRKAENDVVFTE
jgi:hypothetical protein